MFSFSESGNGRVGAHRVHQAEGVDIAAGPSSLRADGVDLRAARAGARRVEQHEVAGRAAREAVTVELGVVRDADDGTVLVRAVDQGAVGPAPRRIDDHERAAGAADEAVVLALPGSV